MSGFSATAKNFAVTVSVAVVAVAVDKGVPALLWAGGVAVIAFLLMDGYYHLLEVRFRELYRATALRPIESGSDMLLEAPKTTTANVKKVLLSVTVLPFYVLLLFALLVALNEVKHVHAAELEAVPLAACDPCASPSGQAFAGAQRAGGPSQSAKADKRLDRPAGSSVPLKDERAGDVP